MPALPTLLIYIIVIAAAIGIAMIATRAMGVQIPAWVFQIFWVIVVCMVAVWGIRFVFSL